MVTIGGLLNKSPPSLDTFLLIIFSGISSTIGVCPNSLTIYSAVSLSIEWLIVALTPIFNKNLIILADCSAILLDNSWIVICCGIFTSLITFLNSFLISSVVFFFSLSLALLTEAKLLCFISNSSTFIAVEIVNLDCLFISLFFNVDLSLFLSLLIFSSDLINLLVACCSTNFLLKFLLFGLSFILFWSDQFCLVFGEVLKLFFFSITYDFFVVLP